MIDYLEDLVGEETAVELTGRPLATVGRRKVPLWEEDEPFRAGQSPLGTTPPDGVVLQGKEQTREPTGRPSWVEETELPRTGAAELLTALTRTAQAAGVVRQQAPLTVTLTGESPQTGNLDLHAIDRAVQRDARRYDGGFPLY